MEADDAPTGIESFDGASAAAQQEPALDHQCARCGQKFAFYSHLAFLTKEGQFAGNRNTDITRAIEKGAGLSFENKFEGSEVVLTCWQCCQKLHGVEYRKDGKLTSEWQNKQRATKRTKMPPSKLARVLNVLDQQMEKCGSTAKVGEVYAELDKNHTTRSASDFVYEFGPGMYLLYGCRTCETYPLRSSSWWRCVTNTDAEGMTETGGHWRCANCISRWTWAVGGAGRLIVVGDGDEYFMGLIGCSHNASVENKMNFLKTCTMLTALEGKPVTKATLLAVIAEINDRVEARLGQLVETKTFTSKDPRSLGVKPYCEDERLSMKRPGLTYKAIDITLCRSKPAPLDPDDLELLIDVAASFMDIEGTTPAGPAMKQTQNKLCASKNVLMARSTVRRHLPAM